MCHHYKGSRNPPEHLADEFSIRSNHYQLLLPEAGFYPLGSPPIVRLDETGQREMVAAEWGLLPAWWKPSEKTPKRSTFQRKCFNARSEEIDVKPSYRDAFKRRRCLMPASEFMEHGHYFHLPEHRTFALAGIWERWNGAGGEVVESCTMLTTEANAEVASVGQTRMPVVLTGEAAYAKWLNAELSNRAALESLFRPFSACELEFYQPQK
jgi:putative SOS response-associated peptidase YedK